MPRRYSDYPDSIRSINLISSFGSIIRFVGVILFVAIVVESLAVQRCVLVSDYPSSSLD